MKVFLIVTLIAFSVTSTNAYAQLWGAGVYPGAQACPAPYARERLPEGLQDIDDDIDLLQQDLREAKEDLREMKRRQRDVNRDYDQAISGIRGVLKNGDAQNSQGHNVAQAVIDHIQMNRPGDQALYEPANVCNTQGGDLPWPTFCAQVEGTGVNQPALQYPRWIRAGESGRVDPAICSATSSAVRDDVRSDYQRSKCSEAVGRLPDLHGRKVGLDQQISERERLVTDLELQIKDLRDQRKDEMREYRRAQRRGEDTEGGYCYSCNHPNDRPVSTFDKIASVGLGALGAYLGYRGTQRAINRTVEMNGNLGWPTDPRYTSGLAMGAAMPGVMFGIYGLTHGLGTGGCAGQFPYGGMGGIGGLMGPAGYPMMGGAFGYPQGWGGMPGGGVFMPGMGGIGGMYPGYGLPGGGPFIGGIVGGFAGMPMGGMPMAGMPMAGMPMAGMPMGGMPYAGMPYGGMPMAGMPMGGMPYAGMPMAGGPYAGAFAGGFPAGGFPAGGGAPFVGGIAGGFVGMPMAGMPMAGGPYAGMPMAGGMPYAGMPMVGGPYAGMPMAGPFSGAPNAGMQYQQFLMQQQQQMMQMQMRAQQEYMNRQQVIGRLSSQMMQIQMQIQQISMGVYGGGYYSGGGGVGGGVGGGGPTILPYPGPGQPGGFPSYPGTGGPSPYDPNVGRPTPARGP